MKEKERRPIPGHRQYEITEDGTVFRISGPKWSKTRSADGSLKQSFHPVRGFDRESGNGYMYVTLLTKDYPVNDFYTKEPCVIDLCDIRPVSVHRLVCKAFHGMSPEGKPWVNHKDGIKLNNHYTNLEWSSISENIQHAFDTGMRKVVTGKDHWKFGVKTKDSTRELQSISKIGEKHPKFKGWYVKDGIEYASAIIAAKATGELQKTIISRTRRGDKGWSFKPKETVNQ